MSADRPEPLPSDPEAVLDLVAARLDADRPALLTRSQLRVPHALPGPWFRHVALGCVDQSGGEEHAYSLVVGLGAGGAVRCAGLVVDGPGSKSLDLAELDVAAVVRRMDALGSEPFRERMALAIARRKRRVLADLTALLAEAAPAIFQAEQAHPRQDPAYWATGRVMVLSTKATIVGPRRVTAVFAGGQIQTAEEASILAAVIRDWLVENWARPFDVVVSDPHTGVSAGARHAPSRHREGGA